MDYAELLNPSQLAAVENTDGASVIVAGAGSGKTRVLTYKIAYLIEQGIPASSILVLTFANKAAREMRNRIQEVVGLQQSKLLWMGTFHSIFLRILRIEASRIGFNPQFTVYDTSDSKSLIKTIIKQLALDEKTYKPSVVQNRISAAKNSMMDERDYADNKEARLSDNRYNRPLLYLVYQLYQQRLREANAMDFDDLLMFTAKLFIMNSDVLEKYQERFRYLLVDEYQDTNAVQHQVVTMLAKKYGNVCVVGDDAQSIYSFRGAEIQNILSFRNIFPGCKLFKLEQNYRSTQTIVNAANSLIEKNRNQIRKRVFSKNSVGSPIKVSQCMDDVMEAEEIAREVQRQVDGRFSSYSDIAVLYRTNAQSRVLEDCFRRKKIPYKIYGGLSFYQRKEIKDITAYIRLLVNHEDVEALKRIINVPARGIGQTTLEKILRAKGENMDVDMLDILCQPGEYSSELNAGAQKKIMEFGQLIKLHSDMVADADAYSVVKSLLTGSRLLADAASDTTPEGILRFKNLQEFEGAVLEFCEKKGNDGDTEIGLADFLSEISLRTDQDNSKTEGTDTVTLMTIHSAKGEEFDVIFVSGVEENLLPGMKPLSPSEIEEERRLLYVAITRAKESCFISFAQSRFINGQRMFSEPSRFIQDIDAEYLNLPRGMQRARKSFQKPLEAFPVKQDAEVLGSVTAGMKVVHTKFGKGVVVSTEGMGDNARAVVKFETSGVKTLILKFARLRLDISDLD
ncbi:MAG: UvrD-helicase domain-containing protein [Paludibacteraceae bacterium]|nr:UvrD-helicase domain-containing protein [Paludibacteraceae bacterium]